MAETWDLRMVLLKLCRDAVPTLPSAADPRGGSGERLAVGNTKRQADAMSSHPYLGAQTGSDMCERYQRLAVSGWEHNRSRSKLREMKSDPWSLNLPLTLGMI